MFNTRNESNLTGMIEENIFEPQSKDKVMELSKALSNPVRIDILHQLFESPKSITELAKLNKITNATVIFHLEILEKATLIYSKTMPSKKGKTLIFFINFTQLRLYTSETNSESTEVFAQSMAVGNYIDAEFNKYVRIATENESFILENNDVFDARRTGAQLIGTDNGRFSYAFGNSFAKHYQVEKLEFSLEICSEAPYYRNDWKSEITFGVNGIELTTYLATGDYGGKRGKLNPDWWEDKFTQFGRLVEITITNSGVMLNGEKVAASPTLGELKISGGNRILFDVYVKKGVKYAGGFNLFGKKFGNHPQDIMLKAYYKK